MDLTKPLRRSIRLSQAFGLISFEIRESSGKTIFFSESRNRLKIVRINFGLTIVLHFLLVAFSTDEIVSAKDELILKIVRFVNLMAFSGEIAVMFLIVATKGNIICCGLNEMNELHSWFLSRRPPTRRAKNNFLLLLGTLANYLVTVFPLMLKALYVQRKKGPKVMTYAYYTFSMWLENVFVYQFVTIVGFVGEVYACVTQILVSPEMTKSQMLAELRRSRAHEEIVKNFIESLLNVYRYALFFWICWSFTMILQFVLKVNIRLRVVIWCFFVSIRVIAIIFGCSIIKNETERTAQNLHELFIVTDDHQIKEEIEIYSFQLLHRKPDFNALGFFSLDFPLFHSMVASLATYIVILMQLKGLTDPENVKENHTSSNSIYS